MKNVGNRVAVMLMLVIGCQLRAADNEPGPIDKDAPQKMTTTKSGLKYRILRKSDKEKPSSDASVKVNYRGWLPNPQNPEKGREFDSSYKRGEPITFPLNGVIPGWGEGMQLVGKGGMIELEIPPKLGYGEAGAPGAIPPNATLRFIVELLDISEPPKQGPTDPDAAKEFQTTKSGLKYRILRKGKGASPKASSTVTVHYRGWLPAEEDPSTGKEFDSSYKRSEPATFPLSGVIRGWTEGLQLVQEGGMIELEILPGLAYGGRRAGDIPPNSTLRFVVELIKVQN